MEIEKLSHYAIPNSCGCSTPRPSIDPSLFIPKAWESRYAELAFDESHVLRDDITDGYTPQGATTDGTYIYRALVRADEDGTWLQKIRISDGVIVKESKAISFGHANDLCYAHGKIYIAHSASTSVVYVVNRETFALENAFNLPTTIWGIDYEPKTDLFILGTVGSGYLSVYYPDFKFMYRIKPANAFYGMVRQGIACDSNYIYISLDNAYGAVLHNEMGSRIMVYTWNGIFVKSFHIPIAEIEWALPINNTMYIGTYEGRDPNDVKSGRILAIPYDLYPEQTVLTGRPTDVSGGMNNLQRLPEGTPVRLWDSEGVSEGIIKLESASHGVSVTESSPFRYLRFRFRGANASVFDWYPVNNGVATLREFDVTAAEINSTVRFREARLIFNESEQTFTIESNLCEELFSDVSAKTLTLSKTTTHKIFVEQIWGVV